MTQLHHKGYVGSVEVSLEDSVVFGKLLHIRDLITYEADEIAGIEQAFIEAVDDYLADCEESGQTPDKPFKGQFNVRVGADLHRELAVSAMSENSSLNEYVARVLGCHNHVEKDGQIRVPKADVRVVIQGVSEGTLVENNAPVYATPLKSRTSEVIELQPYPNFAVVRSNKTMRVQ